MGVHGGIEFGNRLLGVVLEVVGVLLLIAVLRARPVAPASWRWLAAVQVLVVPAQAAIGGILVLTNLNPYVRTLHFLASFPITLAAAALLRRALDGTAARAPATGAHLRVLTGSLIVVTAAVTAVGALVTGAGQHAGDPRAARLPFDPATITQFHTDLVFLLLGLLLATVVTAHGAGAPKAVRQALQATVVLVLAQGVVGYVQYFTGVPVVLVGLHMLGSVLVFLAAAWSHLSTTGPIAHGIDPPRRQLDPVLRQLG